MSELGFLGAASTTTKIHSVGRPRSDACVKEESGFHYYSSCRQFGLDHVDKEDLSENVKCVEPTDEWRITLVTYNLNKRRAPNFSIDMRTFFSQDEVDKSDIIVIGLQEISHWELFGGEQWRKKFSNILCPRNFTQLSLATTADLKLGTNQLLIFVKQRVLMSIRKTEAHFVRYFHWTDKSLIYSGIAGHKASIGAKISFKNGSYLLLITSHLSARPNAYNKRIREYNSTKWAMPLTKTSSKEHGYTFWLGDLNFRVNDLSAPEVVGCLKNISSDQMHTLLDQHDQLQMAQKVGDAFVDYVEPNVTFPPTYRMIVGSGEYDLLRVPSWCDRILFRVNDSVESLAVKTLSYESLPSVQFSDHVPVKGTFSLRMPTAKDVIGGNKWTIRFDVNTESVSSPYESSVSVRFQAAGSFWKTTGSFFDWIGAYKDDMDDTRQPIAWKYVLSCWDDQIGSETWSYTKFAGLLSGRYRIGYYSRYCDCIIGLSQAFEVRDMTVLAIDRFRFNVKAGAGGNGLARYNGVGGDGGDIYLHARNDVQFKRLLKQLDNADLQRMRGEIGAAATQTKLIGKRGQDTVFKVPTGVEVINADTDTVIVRCNTHDKRYLLAKGGEGGKSTNNFVGQLGEQFNIILSLKLRVDVGLI
uniref:Obg domain-containing protein n=1 Tax=Plectus sambesii TaxID=2011161 RepID=A0A914X9X2_9BILA